MLIPNIEQLEEIKKIILENYSSDGIFCPLLVLLNQQGHNILHISGEAIVDLIEFYLENMEPELIKDTKSGENPPAYYRYNNYTPVWEEKAKDLGKSWQEHREVK